MVELAQGLAELGWEVVASGGTAAHLQEQGVAVETVEELTEVPELLGGRVKTLHPRIHAAILARRDNVEDLAALHQHEIRPFDLVCVNLYPFLDVVGRFGTSEEDAVEMIDVGGPSLLRGAAKNFAHVVPLSRPEQYGPVVDELRERGELSRETRRRLAAEAFAATAAYEAAIAGWFSEVEALPGRLIVSLTKELDLAYGENPHQRAAYYSEAGARRHLLSRVERADESDKGLSYNNLNDLSAGRLLLDEFALPACAIVKHANPCGAAIAGSIDEAYMHALACDRTSAYGGVVLLNRPVGPELADRISAQFIDVLYAPEYEPGALEALGARPTTRILVDRERRRAARGEREYRRVVGGVLVQDRDADVEDRDGMTVVSGEPGERQWGDLLFAWRVCKHVASNAIVIATGLRTVGIGAGQMSRVDAVRIAVAKAREAGHDLEGAALASDGFFPFPDGPQLALDAGVRFLVQPGGSKRDAEVVAAVAAAGGTMVLTGRRHFRH